jgi:hypothetical protein
MTGACAAGCAKTPLVPPPPPPPPFQVFSASWNGSVTINVSGANGTVSGYFEILFQGGTGGVSRSFTYETRSSTKVSLSGDLSFHPGLSYSGLNVDETVAISVRGTGTDGAGATASAVMPSAGVIIIKRTS